jgi:hypothetical protein
MKILKRLEDNLVIYTGDVYLYADKAIANDCHDQFLNIDNAIIEEVTELPKKFSGACWTYLDGVWTCINQEFIDELFPQPSATLCQIRLALLKLGKLDEIETKIKTASKEIQIVWEYAIIVKSDDSLVELFDMTEQEVEDFFDNASKI